MKLLKVTLTVTAVVVISTIAFHQGAMHGQSIRRKIEKGERHGL